MHMWLSYKEKHGSNNYEVEDNDHYWGTEMHVIMRDIEIQRFL